MAPRTPRGIRRTIKWTTPDGKEWPDAESAAEHARLAPLQEWFERRFGGAFDTAALARQFDAEFSALPRTKGSPR